MSDTDPTSFGAEQLGNEPVVETPEDLAEALGADPNAPKTIDTENKRLDDGVNRCPKCASTDIQLRPSTGMLVCLFCRHEWSEERV
ncbi:MAG: hypothetical protein E6Q27_05085, partial [Aeromicrobium sp.]